MVVSMLEIDHCSKVGTERFLLVNWARLLHICSIEVFEIKYLGGGLLPMSVLIAVLFEYIESWNSCWSLPVSCVRVLFLELFSMMYRVFKRLIWPPYTKKGKGTFLQMEPLYIIKYSEWIHPNEVFEIKVSLHKKWNILAYLYETLMKCPETYHYKLKFVRECIVKQTFWWLLKKWTTKHWSARRYLLYYIM